MSSERVARASEGAHTFPEDFLVHVGLQVAHAYALTDERGTLLGVIHRQRIRVTLRGELGPYTASDVEEAVRRALSSAGRRRVEEEMDEDLQSLLRREESSTAP
ncbi:hypothetical protein ACLESO_33050 [Pyxidicoccus sp. 3LG]